MKADPRADILSPLDWDAFYLGLLKCGSLEDVARAHVEARMAALASLEADLAIKEEALRVYDALDQSLDNLLDYLKLAGWREHKDRNVKAALKWAEQVALDYGRMNRAVLTALSGHA